MIKRAKNLPLFSNPTISLGIILAVFSLLRLPSVVEPYWYGDEGVYEVLGQAIAHGRILYSQIWDNKPPLLYLIYALFSGDQFYARLASLVAGFFAVVVFFAIAGKIFKNKSSIFLSTSIFAVLFGLPILEGNIANAENFMLLPILMAFYLLFVSDIKNELKLIFSGLLLSFAFLTKIVAVFDFSAFSVGLLGLTFFDAFPIKNIKWEIKKFVDYLRREIILGVSFLVPIVITALYFFAVHAFPDFFKATFSQNVGYVGYGNYFLFPMGLLFLKLFLLGASIIVSFVFRKSLGKFGFLIFVWLSFSLFNSFFSARPYTHYLLVLLPSFCLFIGNILENKKVSKFSILLLVIILFFVNKNFGFYSKVIPYYQNYLAYVSGAKSVTSYQSFFDRKTPRDYILAQFLETNAKPSDGIFLWGDDPQVYALSKKLPPGRYTVSYHITFYKNGIPETQKAIAKAAPRYIIQTKDADPTIGNFLAGYQLRYKLEGATIYERQF